MRKFFLILALVFSFNVHGAAATTPDETIGVICKIIGYAHGLGGPMITRGNNWCFSPCNIR